MKKLALGLALGVSLVSSVAVAAEQRPTYLAFRAPVATANSSNLAGFASVAPSVKKANSGFGTIPVFVPLAGLIIVIGLVAAVATGRNGSPG